MSSVLDGSDSASSDLSDSVFLNASGLVLIASVTHKGYTKTRAVTLRRPCDRIKHSQYDGMGLGQVGRNTAYVH